MIAAVYVFANGMVMVFDAQGQQLPQYQGTWTERRDVILRDLPADVVITRGTWLHGM